MRKWVIVFFFPDGSDASEEVSTNEWWPSAVTSAWLRYHTKNYGKKPTMENPVRVVLNRLA